MFVDYKDQNCSKCRCKAPSFKFLSESEINLIEENRKEVVYKSGEVIFKQGTANTHVISFNSGLAKIYLEGYNKKNLIVRLVKANEFIASPGLSTENKHFYSISAIEPSTVCFIETMVFRQLFKNNQTFAENLMRDIHQNYSKTLQKLINLNQKHRLGRMSEALLYLAEEIYEADIFELPLTKKELADMTGMSTESSFRILKELNEEEKIKINKRQIEILNKDYLRQMSDVG
jgi:CRP/FNR family transcriptional regulator